MTMTAITALKKYMEDGPSGRKVTMSELKELTSAERKELGELAAKELGADVHGHGGSGALEKPKT